MDRKGESSREGYISLVVLSVIAVLIAVVALVVGSFGFVRRGEIIVNVPSGNAMPTPGGPAEPTPMHDDKIWAIAIGNYGVNLEYFDEESEEIRGYNVDVINAVCRIADKNCELVWDVYEHCWRTVAGEPPRGGIGLQGAWYDACTAWPVTFARSRTFKFTTDMSKAHLAIFLVPAGTPADAFNWRDLRGKRIGFLQAYTEDEVCVRRQAEITGRNLTAEQIRYYIDEQALLSALNNGEVDAIFVNEYLDLVSQLQKASERVDKCAKGGHAMMLRKSGTLPSWWNPAFKTLIESPEYVEICRGLRDPQIHGHFPGPSAEQHCVGL